MSNYKRITVSVTIVHASTSEVSCITRNYDANGSTDILTQTYLDVSMNDRRDSRFSGITVEVYESGNLHMPEGRYERVRVCKFDAYLDQSGRYKLSGLIELL